MGVFDFFKKGKNSSEEFFTSTFQMLGKLAAADGTITEDEIQAVHKFMGEYLNLRPEQQDEAIKLFHDGASSQAAFVQLAIQLNDAFPGNQIIQDAVLDVLLQVSVADGEMSAGEEALMRDAARVFGFNDAQFDHLKALHLAVGTQSSEALHYLRLGCYPYCTDEELDAQYQTLLQRYSVDTALASGVPEEFVNLVRKKLEDVEESYAIVKLRRSES